MERKLATIQLVESLTPIEGADRIETAHVLGWEVVVKKDEFKVGDKVVYIEVDSILPEIPVFEFMRERKFRVKTIKLRKQISQGLILSLFDLGLVSSHSVGKDVTTLLNITKYDPQQLEEDKLLAQKEALHRGRIQKFLYKYKWYRNLFLKTKKKDKFPSFISKTDEERIQNMPKILTTIKENNILVDITEKIDGQSATYFMVKHLVKKWYQFKPTIEYKFGVCSRNLHLPTPTSGSYWAMAEKYNIEQSLKRLYICLPKETKLIVLQGENVGPGIQNNKYKLKEGEFFAFNLKIDSKKQNYESMYDNLKSVNPNIECVPLLYHNYILPETVHEVVELSKGHSLLNPQVKREGTVTRNNENNISFKTINPEFLLKFEEA